MNGDLDLSADAILGSNGFEINEDLLDLNELEKEIAMLRE
jgi:hypothetical protein